MIHQMIPTYMHLLFVFSPVVITVIIFYVSKFIFKHQWRAVHFTVQTSAVLYILAVTLLLEQLLNRVVIGTILIILLLILALLLIVQWKKDTDVELRRGLKVLLRLSFLAFGLLYILLLSYEVIQLILINFNKL